ncbi:MAG: zf-TFIIB domain-containing protein [Paracoccaceae bacterium]
MRCPVDNETLVMSDRHGVEIDYCPKCRGVWLDRGELDKIIERAAGADAPVALREPGRPAAAPAAQTYAEAPRREEPRREDPRREDSRREEPRRRRDDDDDDDYRRPRKRRESFLSDLFDF